MKQSFGSTLLFGHRFYTIHTPQLIFAIFSILPLLLFKEQLKFYPFMEIRDVGTISQIPRGGGVQTVASVPALARLLTKAVLYAALGAAFPTCTVDNSKINNKKEGRAASKINRVVLNIQGHEIFIQHHLFGVHAERLAPGIEFY